MKFSEQIKNLRKKNNLTQGELAERLHVTRQAVSNWENDKNLPDLETIICISQEFHVSLDELILSGDHRMNEISEKLVKDGSENRRARMNMMTVIIGGMIIFMGMMCFVIKGNSPEYIDEEGFLHENFALIPIGYLLLFTGVVTILVTFIFFVIKTHKKK